MSPNFHAILSCTRPVFSTVLLVIFNRPTYLLPSCYHSIPSMQSLFLSILSACPVARRGKHVPVLTKPFIEQKSHSRSP